MKDSFRSLGRRVLGAFTIVAGVFLLWRGHAFDDPYGAGITVPLMCALTALLFTLTGLSALMQREEEDYQS